MANPTSGPNSAKPTTGEVIAGVYNATPPTLADGQACPLQVDVNGQIKTSGGGGGSSNVNLTGINGVAPALNNALPVELSDGTNAVGTAGNPLSVNVITGGGSNASVSATGAAVPASATYMGVNKGGNLVAPLADPSGNLQTVISEALPAGTNVIGHAIVDSGTITANQGTAAAGTAGWPIVTGNLAESTAAWTNATAGNTAVTVTVTGYNTVVVTLNQGTTITGGVVAFEVSDTTGFTNAYPILGLTCLASVASTGANVTTQQQYVLVASTNQAFLFNVAGWAAFRVRLSTVISGTGTVNVGISSSAASTVPITVAAGNSQLILNNNSIVAVLNGATTDAGANNALNNFTVNGGGNRTGAVGIVGYTGQATAANSVTMRTPNVWRGSQFGAAGQNILWMPPTTKKIRLMRYKIEIGEDATITSGPLPINLAFCEQLGTATGATLAYPGFGYTHRDVIPATVLATGANLSDSDWVELDNGQVLTTAGRALQMGIMVPQTTGPVNPTWTTSSVTWEAATIGFKTNGSLGNFKLVQQTNAVASAASVATAAIQVVTGNSVFVVWRATVAGGAPTVTVTDTAGNTYTNAAQVTTGNDYIGIAYSINATGNAANVITVTTTTHTSTQIEAIALEYAGLGSGGIDAAQVGTTGTSTAPASGNYTPATAGDLILSFFGTSASIASQPTVGSNFRIVGSLFNATQGSLNVADNFGNGTLATGLVNVICAGVEE